MFGVKCNSAIVDKFSTCYIVIYSISFIEDKRMIRLTIIVRSNSALIPAQNVCYKTQVAEHNSILFGYENQPSNIPLRLSI